MAMLWIPARITIARRRHPRPEALFVLGGHLSRFHHALAMAADWPDLPIVVSSGITAERARYLAIKAGIDPQRLVIDHQAVDTLTNFTRSLDIMEQRGVRHVFLITSSYHMRRARIVAALVFGSHGIVTTPVPVSSRGPPEPLRQALRDGLRSLAWWVSGWDGQSVPLMQPAPADDPAPEP